jgi:hypothetical protein
VSPSFQAAKISSLPTLKGPKKRARPHPGEPLHPAPLQAEAKGGKPGGQEGVLAEHRGEENQASCPLPEGHLQGLEGPFPKGHQVKPLLRGKVLQKGEAGRGGKRPAEKAHQAHAPFILQAMDKDAFLAKETLDKTLGVRYLKAEKDEVVAELAVSP